MDKKILKINEKIPDGYKTYTLFLIPSTRWTTKNQFQAVTELRTQFMDFGDAIGEKNCALFFAKEKDDTLNPDIIRSKDYCDKYELDYNDGPFIVFMENNPDLATKKDIITIQFKNIESSRIVKYLNNLEQNIRRDEKIERVSNLDYFHEISRKVLKDNKESIIKVTSGIIGKVIPG